MPHDHSPVARYRRATTHLPRLSERQQVLALKFELFRALVRAAALEDRVRELAAAGPHDQVASLAPSVREARLSALAKTLFASLCRKAAALEALERRHATELLDLKARLRDAQERSRQLSELSDGLLDSVTLDLAAEMIADEDSGDGVAVAEAAS